MGPQDHQGRPILIGHCLPKTRFDCRKVVGSFAELDDLPAIRFEPPSSIIGERQFRATVNGDVVIVVDAGQTSKTKVTGQRGGLVTQSLL